jgi:methyl-accepting chemotaxis protein
MTPIRAALPLILLTLAAGGCGDGEGDSNEFREGYNAAVERLGAINSDIGQAAGQSNEEIAREFRQLAERTAETRSDLSRLSPPEDARDEFDELLASLRQGIRDLRAVAKAARSSDPQAASEAARKLARTGEEISAAETALKDEVDGP